MTSLPTSDPAALEALVTDLQDVTSALALLIGAAYSASFVLREESERGVKYPAGLRQSIREGWDDGLARYAAVRDHLDAIDRLIETPADRKAA